MGWCDVPKSVVYGSSASTTEAGLSAECTASRTGRPVWRAVHCRPSCPKTELRGGVHFWHGCLQGCLLLLEVVCVSCFKCQQFATWMWLQLFLLCVQLSVLAFVAIESAQTTVKNKAAHAWKSQWLQALLGGCKMAGSKVTRSGGLVSPT